MGVVKDKDYEINAFLPNSYYLVFRKGNCSFEKVVVGEYYYRMYSAGDEFLEETISESIDRQRKELDSLIENLPK